MDIEIKEEIAIKEEPLALVSEETATALFYKHDPENMRTNH